MAKVLNRKRDGIPAGAVYIGRPERRDEVPALRDPQL